MNGLVLAPQRYGIREVALRVGQEWESLGHDVDYDLPDGDAARIGPLTVGVPGIALWWDRWFRQLEDSYQEYDLIWTHQPLTPRLPTHNPDLWDRVVVTFHTTEYAKHALARDGIYPRNRRLYHLVTKQMERRFYQKLSELDDANPKYTVVSPQLKDEIAEFGVGQADCIPNGIFVPEKQSFEPIRSEYGIPDEATVVFNIGSLSPQKRPALFAETMAEVCNQREDLYCIMAGKGPKAEAVEEQTTDRVKAIGFVSDEEKWRWFADADLFASLSAYEGMPVATLEALSFGLPIVLSDIPAHRAVIDEYDATGECIQPRANEMLTAINRYEGEQVAVSLPTWSDVGEEYLTLVS